MNAVMVRYGTHTHTPSQSKWAKVHSFILAPSLSLPPFDASRFAFPIYLYVCASVAVPRCDFAPTLKIVLQQSEIIVKHNPLLQWTTRLYMGSPFKWTSKWCCEGGWVRFTKWAVVRIEQILCGITLGLFYQTHFNHNQFKPCVYYTTSMEEDEDNMCNAHTQTQTHAPIHKHSYPFTRSMSMVFML